MSRDVGAKRGLMSLGFAITEHCNLRCRHCIRDDVTTVRFLEADLIFSVVEQAQSLYESVTASLTGGEPLLHPRFESIAAGFAELGVPYRFVTNGWHLQRVMPTLDRCPPESVRLSLSGADERVHDAERGRGSFRRVLLSVALLTSRRIPTYLSMVVDRRDRHQLREAVALAEGLGCLGISFILPQPTPGSAARNSDLPPAGWWRVSEEVAALARDRQRRTRILLDYGAPFAGSEEACDTFELRRIYVDTRGRLCTCCQLSNYGFNELEVVADLHEMSLAEAYGDYLDRLAELRAQQLPDAEAPDVTDPFPCLRCARACGKLDWLKGYPRSVWHSAARANTEASALVSV